MNGQTTRLSIVTTYYLKFWNVAISKGFKTVIVHVVLALTCQLFADY